MVSKNQKKIQEIAIKIEKSVKDIEKNSFEYSEMLADDIRKRVRLGYGVSGDGLPRKKLKAITAQTIKARQRLKDKNKLHPMTSPGRSNLTRTGQLTDAIVAKKDSKKRIAVEIEENRDDGVLNSDIVLGQENEGRPFFYVTDLEKKRLFDLIKKQILKSIRG